MWKKPFKVQKSNLVKASDKKKLKEKLLSLFPNLTKESLDELIPTKEELHQVKLSGSRTIIYTDKSNEPLFVDADGRENYYPTVYALWKLPPFLPAFNIHPATFKYISRGADLMLPGVIPPEGGFEEFHHGQLRAVQFVGTKTAVAVGVTTCSSADIAKNGMKGKALQITHYYTDQLWRSGSKTSPTIEFLDDDPSAETEEPDMPGEDNNLQEGEDVKPADTPAESENAQQLESDVGASPVISEGTANNEPESGDASAAPAEETRNEVSPDEMDRIIETAFMQAIKRRLKDTHLPILASTFHANFMLPCRPIDSNINWKNSSFKKLSTFLNNQAQDGLIEVTEQDGVLKITRINREHPKYNAFTPLAIKATYESIQNEEQETETTSAQPSFSVREFVALPKNLQFLVPPDYTGRNDFTPQECTQFLWDYVSQQNLTLPDKPTHVKLDPQIAQCLWPKQQVPDIVSKAELAKKFKDVLVKMHEIIIDGESTIRKGDVRKVVVTKEQRQGRKWVTKIDGLHNFGIDAKEVARLCQRKFASSATTSKIPASKANPKETFAVLIQGSFENEVVDLLHTELGIPHKYIEKK